MAQLFLSRVAETPDRVAYRYPVPVDELAADGAPGAEQWRTMTWGQAAEQVTAIAGGLMALGIRPEERVANRHHRHYGAGISAIIASITRSAFTPSVVRR